MDKNKTYRCICKPSSKRGFGRWEYEYKGKWHEVGKYYGKTYYIFRFLKLGGTRQAIKRDRERNLWILTHNGTEEYAHKTLDKVLEKADYL